ncbi:hypothetical protein Q3G72_023030 [Acer saccharum]|nr:hypothetical protein Q3G72_023030 [Acer saccharum]
MECMKLIGSTDSKVCLTYWLNELQNIGETRLPFLVTLNPDHTPEHTLLKWSTGHLVQSAVASKASLELDHIQGKRGIWFCGANQDSYINGDFSFLDKDEGLINLFLIFIANRDLDPSRAKLNQKRGWWSPLFFTAGIASAKYFIQHILKRNTLTQARKNIAHHYDMREDEDLNVAQMRKISLLIEKARISKEQEVLDIGCGWGCLAIEAVKRTGCKYTGITLSEEQLKYAEMKVKEAGLQDHIRLYLCDYRQLPKTNKYDRIISCEMIEAVGHEFIEEFFGCCESKMGFLFYRVFELFQFTSVPDQHYNEHRLSPGFVKEYIFPGGCLPSLNRITIAMTSASRLWEVLALGFNEKFIRMWEYYLDYCAAGFKSRTLGNYQVAITANI